MEITIEKILEAISVASEKMAQHACKKCGIAPSMWGECQNCGEYYILDHKENCPRAENEEDLEAELKFWNHADHDFCSTECCKSGHRLASDEVIDDLLY